MSIADWDHYIDVASGGAVASQIEVKIETTSALISAGSLRFSFVTGQDTGIYFVPSALSHAEVSAKMRTFIQEDFTTLNLGQDIHIGLAFLTGQRDITSTGSFYLACFLVSRQNAGVRAVELRKFSKGLLSTSSLLSAVQFFSAERVTLSLEAEWSISAGGTQIIVRQGSALDYADLSALLSHLDTTLPLLTTSGEGVAISDQNTNPQLDGIVTFDDTTLIRLT